MNPKFHQYFMDVAHLTAKLSSARRLKVGSVAVFDRRIVACGYNGTPEGENNNCEFELEDGTLKTKPNVIHSEDNLIQFAKREEIALWKCTLYVTHRPCLGCAEKIIPSGINKVYWDIDYEQGNDEGAKYLLSQGIIAFNLREVI
jgi:dCMP deaminase